MRRCLSDGLADAVRRFQWFYTRHVWASYELPDHGELSLTECRVLFTIMQAGKTIATELSPKLDINTGYLSRMLTRFERDGLIARSQFAGDGRSSHVSLTPAGERLLAASSTSMRHTVSATLETMTPDEGLQLMASMETVERLLTASDDAPRVRLRGPRPGDFGWIVEREVQLASGGAGPRQAREIRTARAVGDYLMAPDPSRNGCWIAEKDGVSVGGSMLIGTSRSSDARIAVLFVDSDARRKEIGRQLLGACEQFAIELGYARMSCTPGFHHEMVESLLSRNGFQPRHSDKTVWEKYLK